MKQILSILLVLSMLLACSACGAKPAASSDPASGMEPASVQETAAPGSAEEAPASAPEPAASALEPEGANMVDALDGEMVLADDENCIMRIESIAPDNEWGYTWNVYLENKTTTTLMFSVDNVSLNGVMCDPFWATTVPAGQSTTQEISWSTEDFEQLGITDVTVAEFDLSIYDDEDWSAPKLVDAPFTVYPLGKDAAALMERTPGPDDKVLLDNDTCTIIVTGFDPDGLWGYTMNAYLVNKSDQTLTFSTENVTVNGITCDPFWTGTVAPGKASYESISWSPDDFSANSISTVESIEFDCAVFDNKTAEDLFTEHFTVEP